MVSMMVGRKMKDALDMVDTEWSDVAHWFQISTPCGFDAPESSLPSQGVTHHHLFPLDHMLLLSFSMNVNSQQGFLFSSSLSSIAFTNYIVGIPTSFWYAWKHSYPTRASFSYLESFLILAKYESHILPKFFFNKLNRLGTSLPFLDNMFFAFSYELFLNKK